MNDFGQLARPNGSFYNRCRQNLSNFLRTFFVSDCIELENDQDYEYHDYGAYAGLFYQQDTTQRFTSIDDLINASKHIEIHDMIRSFKFNSNGIVIMGHLLQEKDKKKWLKKYWIPFLHYSWGLCHTFDPKIAGFEFVPVYTKDRSSMELELNGLEIAFQVCKTKLISTRQKQRGATAPLIYIP